MNDNEEVAIQIIKHGSKYQTHVWGHMYYLT